ncbi:MAG: hypothetical protein WCV84_02855 [Patescibacteria group bacterium]
MTHILAKFTVVTTLFATLIGTFGVANIASAGALPTNSLVKGTSTSTVYWYATNGKRYVFPNEKTYKSWFGEDYSKVETVPDSYLATMPLIANITYKPGVKLVKIDTDPKVYAVSRYGTLRWIVSADIAATLYGSNWASKVDDIPDAFFINYTVGAPIYSSYDFYQWTEQANVTTISDNIRGLEGTGGVTTPVNGTVTIATTNRYSSVGTEYVTLTASTSNGQAQSITIYDRNNSQNLGSCSNASTCNIALSATTYTSRTVYATAVLSNGTTVTSNDLTINYGTGTVTNPTYTLNVDRTNVNAGDHVNISFNAYGIVNVSRMEIRDSRDNTLIQTFSNLSAGYTSATVYPRAGLTNDSLRYVATVFDMQNMLISTQYSPTITVTGVVTPTYPAFTGNVVMTADRTTARVNEALVITTTVSNTNTAVGNLVTRIYDQNGTIVWASIGQSTCTYTVYPSAIGALRYSAVVSNDRGEQLTTAYSPTITVTQAPVDPGTPPVQPEAPALTGTLLVTADRTEVTAGDVVTFTATLTNANTTADKLMFKFGNAINDTVLWACQGVMTCTYSITAENSGTANTDFATYVTVTNDYGRAIERMSPSVTIRPVVAPPVVAPAITGTVRVTVDTPTGGISAYEGDYLTVNVTVENSNIPVTDMSIDIIDASDATIATHPLIWRCVGSNTCSVSTQTVFRGANNNEYRYEATVSNSQGQSLPVARSASVIVVPNE